MDPNMYAAALLKTMEESGTDVLTLTEGLENGELLGSRLTRREACRLLHAFTESAALLPDDLRRRMPEIDWSALAAAGGALAGPVSPTLDDALLFSIRSLVPATLMWMRVYRQEHPDWFQMVLTN